MNAKVCCVAVAIEVQCVCVKYVWCRIVCAMLECNTLCVCNVLTASACMLHRIAADITFAITDQALTGLCVCSIHPESVKTDPFGSSQRITVGCSPVRLSLGSTGSCLSCITLALTSSQVIVCFPQLSLSLQGPPGSGQNIFRDKFDDRWPTPTVTRALSFDFKIPLSSCQ